MAVPISKCNGSGHQWVGYQLSSRRSKRRLDIASCRAAGNQRAHDQIQRYRWIGCFYLGDARLAGLHACGEIDLRKLSLESGFPDGIDQRESEFDQPRVFLAQLKKILGVADFPSCRTQARKFVCMLFRIHDFNPLREPYLILPCDASDKVLRQAQDER